MLAEEDTEGEHQCDHCTYHPPLHEAAQAILHEVQLCADIERTGHPTIEVLEAHQKSKSLQAFSIDRYAIYNLTEGQLWIPVPQGDEPTGLSRLLKNQWASQRIGRAVYGLVLLVQREDIDHLRRLCVGRCLLPEPTIVNLSFFTLTPNQIKTFDQQGQAGTVSIRPDALIPCCSKYIIIALSCSFPPPMRALIPGRHKASF